MKLHEYQAKQILVKYEIPIPRGGVAATPQEAKEIARLQDGACVIKAQVHAGGRGKAGGIRLAITPEEAEHMAAALLEKRLVTDQTGPEGAPVHFVLVEEALDAHRELYIAITVDPGARGPIVVASSAGGVEVEETARTSPELIFKEPVSPIIGLRSYEARRLAKHLGLDGDVARALVSHMLRLYDLFMDLDCLLVEINPMVVTRDNRVIALDAKLTVDDDALFRHEDLSAMRDWGQEDRLDARAGEAGIAYVKLNGDVGCLVNGAGLAMATMDIIKAGGAQPANFLDVGGGANPERVAQAMSIILDDSQVTRVLVNVFGGIARCDEIAEGIVMAMPDSRKDMPIMVRFLGSMMEEGKKILQDSGLNVRFADELIEATEMLKETAGQ